MFAIGRMPEGHVQSTASVVPVPAAFSIETQWSMIGIRNEDIQFQNRNDTSRYTINPRVIETKKVIEKPKIIAADPKIYPLIGSFNRPIQSILQKLPSRLHYAWRHLRTLMTPPTAKSVKFFPWTPEQLEEIHYIFKKQVEFRFQMKRLVLLYLQRRSKIVNDTDPITLESVVCPVLLYSPSIKSICQINAVSLMNHWTSLLLSHDDFFIEPRFPTNPYTNLPVDILSIKHAINRLRATSNTNWVLESFASCQYNLTTWESRFEQPLNIEAIKNTLKDKSSRDRTEYLVDFAEKQFYEHMTTFDKNMFTWLFKTHPISEYERSWEKLCTQFYIDKTLTKNTELLQKQQDLVTARCKRLTDIPPEIKTEWARKKTQTKRSRQSVEVILRMEDLFPTDLPLLRMDALIEATILGDSDTESEIELDSSEHV